MQSFQDDQHLVPWIARAYKEASYAFSTKLKESGLDLSIEQMIILKHLVLEDGLVQNNLAFITYRDKTSLTRIINKMEQKNLLVRVQCSEDQRCNKIYITEKGRALYDKAQPFIAALMQEIEDFVSKEEKEVSINVLKKVFSHFNKTNL